MKIPAGQFKAKCLQIMDEVEASGEAVTITKHGRPVARLVPARPTEDDRKVSAFGFMKGTVVIQGDIVNSTGEKWDAENDA